jgi:hypothetical protein
MMTVKINISDKLKNILVEIKEESVVARLLLQEEYNVEDLVDNYIDYVSISIQDRTKISYLTSERVKQLSVEDLWTSSRRYQTKPGAFVSKIFRNINSKDIEKFSNLFIQEVTKPVLNFKIVSGRDIKNYYFVESYECEKGSLGASCMKYDRCQEFFGIYENNKEVSLLILLNEHGNLRGRAILWDLGDHKIMDRIYTTNDEHYSFYFKKWATSNGYLYRSEQNWFNSLWFEAIGVPKQELRIEFKLENMNFRYFPYLDTFKFLNLDTMILRNYLVESEINSTRVLCAPDGGKYPGDYLRFDSVDKVYRYSGESVRIHYLSTETFNFYTTSNNAFYSEVNEQYILRVDAIFNEDIQDYIFNDEQNEFNNKEAIIKRLEYYENRRRKIEEMEKRERRERNVQSNGRTSRVTDSISYIEEAIRSNPYFSDLAYSIRRNGDVSDGGEVSVNTDIDVNDIAYQITMDSWGNIDNDVIERIEE